MQIPPPLELAITTLLIMLGTLALMLPVSWVYMSAQRTRTYNQSVVQTLIILPIVVAGVILIVRNSLPLASGRPSTRFRCRPTRSMGPRAALCGCVEARACNRSPSA